MRGIFTRCKRRRSSRQRRGEFCRRGKNLGRWVCIILDDYRKHQSLVALLNFHGNGRQRNEPTGTETQIASLPNIPCRGNSYGGVSSLSPPQNGGPAARHRTIILSYGQRLHSLPICNHPLLNCCVCTLFQSREKYRSEQRSVVHVMAMQSVR